MTAQRFLLIGAQGQLGRELLPILQTAGTVRALTRADADLGHPQTLRMALQRIVEAFQPTAIINAAAYTAVDKAESESELAQAINGQSPGVIAELAQQRGAMMLHYSTDYVFDGSGQHAWQESDTPHPLNAYGRSKLQGERAVMTHCDRHLVLRTSWVVGVHGGNFLKTMLRLAAERDSLQVVADQVGAPASARWLAQASLQVLQAMHDAPATDPRWGVYHLSSSGETSWHGYAQHVIAGALRRGAMLKTVPERVLPLATCDYPLPAARPANSRLNSRKISTTFGINPPPWQAGVDAILDQLLAGHTP